MRLSRRSKTRAGATSYFRRLESQTGCTLKRVLFGVPPLSLAGTSTVAGWAAADHASMLIPQGSGNYAPPPVEPSGLVTIFDNLGRKYPKGLYNAQYGETLAGPSNAFEVPEFWQ